MVFRNVEHTTPVGYVNFYIQEILSGRFKFAESYLLNPHPVDGECLYTSESAVTRTGEIRRDDLLLLKDRSVCKVIRFYMDDSTSLSLYVSQLTAVGVSGKEWSLANAPDTYIDSDLVVAALSWMPRRKGVIYTVMPMFANDAR